MTNIMMVLMTVVGWMACSAAEVPAANDAPGMVSVTWSERDGEQWQVSGLADREAGRPMAKDTVFAMFFASPTTLGIVGIL